MGATASERLLELRIESAGVGDWHIGDPPDERALRHARSRGYDLCAAARRQVRAQDFEEFDMILAMDRGHLQALQRMAPTGTPTLEDPAVDPGLDVPDPYYGGAAGFESVSISSRSLPRAPRRIERLLPSFDLLELLLLRRELRTIAARTAELLRLIFDRHVGRPSRGRSRSSPGPRSPGSPWIDFRSRCAARASVPCAAGPARGQAAAVAFLGR